jgi:hypothetical protein
LYSKDDQIKQEKKLGIIISGRRGHNYRDFSKKLDNAYLSELLNKDFDSSTFKIEEISRIGLKSKKKDKIFYTEIPVDSLPEHIFNDLESSFRPINFIRYQPVSEFPSSTRDFSFSIKDSNKYDAVIDCLSKSNDKYLKDAFVFDFYENKKFNEIKVGVRFIFQSSSTTLSDEEIHKSINKLLKPIIDLDGVSVPGM